MKRGREQEEDLAELLKFLDDKSEGTSNDGDDDREPELEPKHKIFWSHSGVQKNFTEQLCKDLERYHYNPFFDKRPDSLPKGKKFPELIFQAARQCQVAVLILSEDFFTRSKWPMLELEAFVQSQIKNPQKVTILPVYLGLSRNECTKNEIRRDGWVSVWQEWAKKYESIVVAEWKDALGVLGPSNGIEYVQTSGEVALRDEIVSAIRVLVPFEKQWSDANVQGRSRICRALLEKFMRTKPSPLYGVRVVGIHGTGGIGKTTFCKVLCDELNELKFEGKVFPAELGSKSEIELQKEVLRDLTDANPDNLTSATIETTTNLLRRRIREQRVFLALDNVWQESIEEADIYLRAGFHNGSIVMVTARSIDILGRMNIDESDCMEMPELEKEDAKSLFLHQVGFGHQSWSEEDKQKIEHCVGQCKFGKGENMGQHFHPLALKVLGSALRSLGRDPSVWVKSLSSDDKFNQFREKEHPIFRFLRKGFDLLCKEDQLLFMDCILFNPSQICSWLPTLYHIDRPAKFQVNIYEWLSIVHQSKARDIMDRLKGLKAMSLIEGVGDGFGGVTVHDLYREFAELEAKRGGLDARRWVWYHKEAPYPSDLAKRPSGNCWPNMERVLVVYDDCSGPSNGRWMGTFKGVKWQHFSNVVVLQLLIGTNEALDLQGLQCLRSLELRWAGHIEGGGELLGLGELRNLGVLELCNIHYGPCIEEIGHLTRFEVLRLNPGCGIFNWQECLFSPPLERLNLDKCIQLRDLVLECGCLKELPDLSSLTSLRRVLFAGCQRAREVVGLSSQMSSLQELRFIDCGSLSQCHGLGDLVSLQELDIKWCGKFVQLPDLHKLTTLRRLNITGRGIDVAQGFNESMQLQELFVYGVKELVDSHLLRHLRHLSICGDLPIQHMMPSSGNFVALEELMFTELSREVQDLPGIDKLTTLRKLCVDVAPGLLQLPRVGDLVALEYLKLNKCCTEVGAAKLPGLHNLTKLETLDLDGTPIKSLPGLEHLTQLIILDCTDTLLDALPDLSALKNLEVLRLCRVEKLVDLHLLRHLQCLFIKDFTIQHMMPWSGSFLALEDLTLVHLSREVQDLPGIDKLTRLGTLEVNDAPGLLQLPRLGDLVALVCLVLRSC